MLKALSFSFLSLGMKQRRDAQEDPARERQRKLFVNIFERETQ